MDREFEKLLEAIAADGKVTDKERNVLYKAADRLGIDRDMAEVMLEAKQKSCAKELEPGMWHTPYYGEGYWGCLSPDSLEDALAISASCCAQVSYRKLDDSLEKAKDIFAKLIELVFFRMA